MRRLLALSLLCLLPAACLAAPAAQTTIHHCVDADGTPVYTDQPCSHLGATPARSAANALVPGKPRGPRRCAPNRKALEQRVAQAFRTGNANALAALMLWRHYNEYGAVQKMRQLSRLMHWPLLGFADAGAMANAADPATADSRTRVPGLPPLWPAPASTALAAPPMPDVLTLKLQRADAPEVSFPITVRDGCLWLQPG